MFIDIFYTKSCLFLNRVLQWLGMGNQELLEYFSSYSPLKACHSYGPQRHRGMSILIFEASAVGYTEAERLAKHFEDNHKDRLAWEKSRVPFYPGGKPTLWIYCRGARYGQFQPSLMRCSLSFSIHT